MKTYLKISAVSLGLVFITNCSDVSFSPKPPASGGIGGLGAGGIPVGAPIGTTGCDQATLYNVYNSTVTSNQATEDSIAQACETDSDYNTNISIGPTDTFGVSRFTVTCASRWCAAHTGDGSAVGTITSAISYSGPHSLNVGATVTVQCRSNTVQSAPSACSSPIANNPPLTTTTLFFGSGNSCSPCGCDVGTVSNNWNISASSLLNCGTQYCTGLGQGYQWGVLSEVSPTGYAIRCSRAAY